MLSRFVATSSLTPSQLTGTMAGIAPLASVSGSPYDADVTSAFVIAREVANSTAVSPRLPVIFMFREMPEVEISYAARTALANRAAEDLPAAVSGLTGADLPGYPARSYMAGFIDE